MNLSVFRVDGIPGVQPGDEVVLVGRQGEGRLEPGGAPGETVSPYETLCLFGRLNRRRHRGARRPVFL
jgi:alanine racemase